MTGATAFWSARPFLSVRQLSNAPPLQGSLEPYRHRGTPLRLL